MEGKKVGRLEGKKVGPFDDNADYDNDDYGSPVLCRQHTSAECNQGSFCDKLMFVKGKLLLKGGCCNCFILGGGQNNNICNTLYHILKQINVFKFFHTTRSDQPGVDVDPVFKQTSDHLYLTPNNITQGSKW